MQTGICYAPDVCCRFSDRRRAAPAFHDNDFAAASTSEVLTKEGYVVNVPSNQYLPSFPDPEVPDASNDDVNRIKPEIPEAPRTPPPTPPPPTQSPATRPPPPPPTAGPTNPPYQPPPPTPAPYQPTQRPNTQPPPRIIPTTTRQPTYQPQSNEPRPSVVLQDQAIPSIVPSACPAAMNCTKIEYCTSIGVISKTEVVLTDFQKEYRVPMTDCLIMPSRDLGKCCRDPDYTDPWPIGRLGQYNADELNAVFDSGAYKPDGQKTNGKRQVQSSAAQRSSSNPDFAPTNQVVTRVSAPVNQQRIIPQRPNREIPFAPIATQSTNVQTIQSQFCGIRNYVSQFIATYPMYFLIDQ